jgi:hypothetical protein
MHPQPHQDWLSHISSLAKTTKINTRKITTTYTRKCVHKEISKYRHLYNTKPKLVNQKVFKQTETLPLDSLLSRNNIKLTNPTDIAEEIHTQQSHINKPAVPICYYQPDHQPHCTCGIRQYPWHDLDGFIIDKKRSLLHPTPHLL